MSSAIKPTILVIIGVSGDLSKRMLLPAIRQIHKANSLPEQFKIIGISRRKLTKTEVLPGGNTSFLRSALSLRQMDLTEVGDYKKLREHLEEIKASFDSPAQVLFYLSLPPQASQPVVELLGEAGFGAQPDTKILLEKPFGTDYESAQDLVGRIREYFPEEQVYRIDHYLAKEMAQNLVVFRAGNSLFKRTWNKDFIESIEINSSESISVEGRASFYEQTGALRDVVQGHLLQLAALTLMDLPDWNDWAAIPARRLAALSAIKPPQDIAGQVVRGQYKGYRAEAGNPRSMVETFTKLTLFSSNPRWEGVPITLSTGKVMDHKSTEIRIRYRQETAAEANELVLRIQPNEGAEFYLWIKKPGYERELQQLPLDFSYRHHFAGLPDAYERVFVDAMRGDRSLFATSDEVLASWRILAPVQDHWNMTDADLVLYKPGSSADEIK